jgi:hypothetical protein
MGTVPIARKNHHKTSHNQCTASDRQPGVVAKTFRFFDTGCFTGRQRS